MSPYEIAALKFHCVNSTSSWLVAIDEVCIVAADEEEAVALMQKIGEIDDSPFGSANIVPPRIIMRNIFCAVATAEITAHTKCVNTDYIAKRVLRAKRSYLPEPTTARQRLEDKRAWASIFAA